MSRILVLEDDSEFRSFLCEALTLFGHEPLGCASAPEAIAAATRGRYDLIISDVRMAGMDGLDCLAALLPVQPGMRRIVITGYAGDDAPARAIAAQADDYLYKPFELEELMQSVTRVLEAVRERSRYAGLLSSVLARFKPATADWDVVDPRRDLAFQSFYVGVRSRKLSESEALGLWDRLEEMDAQRERAKAEGLSREAGETLLQGYQYVIDLAGALAGSATYLASKRPPGAVPAPQFGRLWNRLKAGEVSLELLKLGPFLRSLESGRLEGEVKEIYLQVWCILTP